MTISGLPDKDARLRRLVAFPLVLLYSLTLVVAAWPRLLQPIPGTVTDVQIGALEVLHVLGIYPGQEVFTGDDRPRDIVIDRCSTITGGFADGSSVTLFDDSARCRAGEKDVWKDSYAFFQDRMLEISLRYARDARRHKNLNRYPLNYLYAITEYYCRIAPAGVVAVEVATFTKTLNYDSGERHERFVVEGRRRCGGDEWLLYESTET